MSVYVSHMCLSMVVLSHFQNAILFSLSHEYLFQDSESAINKKVVIFPNKIEKICYDSRVINFKIFNHNWKQFLCLM